MRFVIFQVNTDFLTNQPNKYFYTRSIHPSYISKQICALQQRSIYQRPLFTTFLLVFTEDKVRNISNKYQPPSNLAKCQCFYTRNFIFFLHRKRSSKHPLFITLLLLLTVGEVCNISNKNWLPNKKYFYTRHLTPLFHLKGKFVLSILQAFKNIDFLPLFYHQKMYNISNKYWLPSNLAKY